MGDVDQLLSDYRENDRGGEVSGRIVISSVKTLRETAVLLSGQGSRVSRNVSVQP